MRRFAENHSLAGLGLLPLTIRLGVYAARLLQVDRIKTAGGSLVSGGSYISISSTEF